MVEQFEVKTAGRTQLVNITARVRKIVGASGVGDGLCVVYAPHTTAGVCINEAADPDVVRDISATLASLVPERAGYAHAEGNSDAHIKSVLTGASVQIPIARGDLFLGTWQGIFLCEYDGPRSRRVAVQVIASSG
ncbi:MAG: YjbQ family protein [Spirochaetales bacterium]|nr:YjbQ family protein [Spirochaetales bacterium]